MNRRLDIFLQYLYDVIISLRSRLRLKSLFWGKHSCVRSCCDQNSFEYALAKQRLYMSNKLKAGLVRCVPHKPRAIINLCKPPHDLDY